MNVLMLRYSGGFEHSYLPDAEVAIKEIGKASGLYQAVTTHQCSRITAENLADVDVLVFATTGELPFDEAQKAALLDFVRGGKGFVGITTPTPATSGLVWRVGGRLLQRPPLDAGGAGEGGGPDHPATGAWAVPSPCSTRSTPIATGTAARRTYSLSLDNSSVDLSKGNRRTTTTRWRGAIGMARGG